MMDNRKYSQIKDVVSFITDGNWIESRHQSDDGFRLIQTGNIGEGIFKAKDNKPHYISEDTFNELGCTEIFEGDCLISRLPDPIGRACIVPSIGCRMITAVDCSILRFKPIVIPNYFVYYTRCSKYQEEIGNYTTGSTRKRISRKNLESIKFPIPSISEQERIVAELDLLSGIIDKQKAQLKELDNLAQSIFYDMFGDPVKNEKGWKTDALKSVAPQKQYCGNVPTKCGKVWLLNLDMVAQQTGEIIGKTYVDSSEIGNSTIIFDSSNVLYSKLRPYLNKVALPDDIGFGTSELVPLKPKQDILNRVFLTYLLRSKPFVDYISIKVAGAKMPRVSMDILRDFPIILPMLEAQESFAQKIVAIELQKSTIQQSIVESQKLFDYTMDKYFG